MRYTLVNNDIIIEEVKHTSNIKCFDIWNLKNDFLCIKINTNLILFNFEQFKIFYNINKKKISLQVFNELIDTNIGNLIEKINLELKNIDTLINRLEYIKNNFSSIEQDNICIDICDNIYDLDLNEEIKYLNVSSLKYLKVLNKLILEINTLNRSKYFHISKNDDKENNILDLNLNILEFKNNNLINQKIEDDIIDSIYINIIIVEDELPNIVFLIDFYNLKLKNKINTKTKSIFKLVNKIFQFLEENDNFKLTSFDYIGKINLLNDIKKKYKNCQKEINNIFESLEYEDIDNISHKKIFLDFYKYFKVDNKNVLNILNKID